MPPNGVAYAFHNDLARSLADSVQALSQSYSTETVALSGGVWQNTLLWDRFCDALPARYRILTNEAVPCNDGGISVGQAALTAALIV